MTTTTHPAYLQVVGAHWRRRRFPLPPLPESCYPPGAVELEATPAACNGWPVCCWNASIPVDDYCRTCPQCPADGRPA